ncbi:E3 ubiquitin-protein ligase TRIM39-like [Microcaecilia unicolor]|uniref:RING-type E3 ubiquitin transferase n=1 Tax=Microcaecilia unicolor TaxID=1415580 RepID=A0A6P7XKD9_9AMPH|nr:E3 ubiquitin-protein ligase TRIM39-like [Microcaecilia unicolor]
MAFANPAERLREEVTCSICLDYFTDPVTTNCAHNFCRSCIAQSWKGAEKYFTCPQCRTRSRKRSLRPNRQLANVVEIAKKLWQDSENLCQQHEEKLKLFCEEDQKMICFICKEARDHRSHTVIPIEEAVQEYKEKNKMHLEPLKKQLEHFLKFKCNEEKKAEELRNETEIQRQKIVSEFEELNQFLNEQKQNLLSRLEQEKKAVFQRIGDKVTQLEEQISSLTHLISEVEKSQQPATDLQKEVKDTLSSMTMLMSLNTVLSLVMDITELAHVSLTWYPPCGAVANPTEPQNKEKCEENIPQGYGAEVDVSLDLETANSWLILSEDQKNVRRGNTRKNLMDNPKRFDTDPCVLGCEDFTSGRHYWEVDVGSESGWILGVCKDSVRRKGGSQLSPDEGYWTVGLCGDEYWALTFPLTSLPLRENPQAVGIFLDYEAGKVSFYNADNKSHLFTFTDTFSEKLRPLFCTLYYQSALRIRPVTASEWSQAQD